MLYMLLKPASHKDDLQASEAVAQNDTSGALVCGNRLYSRPQNIGQQHTIGTVAVFPTVSHSWYDLHTASTCNNVWCSYSAYCIVNCVKLLLLM